MIPLILAALVGAIGLVMVADKSNRLCSWRELYDLTGEGVKCSKNVQLSVKQSSEGVLCVAPCGLGKSRRWLMHNIDLEGSLIVTDPSGEIERECPTDKKKYILNPFSDSIGYDPLANCKDEFEVRKAARTILLNSPGADRQKEWIEMSLPLLTAYMLFNFHTRAHSFSQMIRNLCTLPIIHREAKNIYDEIFSSDATSARTEMNSFMQVYDSPETTASIRTILNSCLQVFLDDRVQKLTDRQGIDFSLLRKEESVLFIQIPERHSEYFAPLTATLVSQLFDRLLDNDGLQVYMLFDEFANIGKIPSFASLLSTVRKRQINICAAIQSLAQFERVYVDEGKEIRELFKTILVMAGLKDSAEYVSGLLGMRKDESLMTPDEVRRLDKDEILIICNNKRPVIDRMMEVWT